MDTLPSREPHPSLTEQVNADLCIVGGGFTGLWAALYAKEQTPAREVVVLEASLCGDGASGRNGGFLQSSLTHGIGNGLSRFPDELVKLERLGLENFHALAHDLERLGIHAEYEATGDLVVALESHELEELDEAAELARRFGHQAEVPPATAYEPSSTRHCSSAGSRRIPAPHSCTPASSPTGCARPWRAPASTSTRAARSMNWVAPTPASR